MLNKATLTAPIFIYVDFCNFKTSAHFIFFHVRCSVGVSLYNKLSLRFQNYFQSIAVRLIGKQHVGVSAHTKQRPLLATACLY